MAGASRTELLTWANDLLQLNITKIEQFGTGAALCQIYDSIFQDIPMSKVKFNVSAEYGYLQNFKVLQAAFDAHKLTRTIPVQALVKCKMQDNLEFLQWTKRYWDANFPGEYDPIARRKASGAPPPTAAAAPRATGTTATRRAIGTGTGTGVRAGAGSAALVKENDQLKETVQGLERERDFYFSKLRDIELLVQQKTEADPTLETNEETLEFQITSILYSTEEGFEIPAAEEEDGHVDDGETF